LNLIIKPCMRFSRTRLTDSLHLKHSHRMSVLCILLIRAHLPPHTTSIKLAFLLVHQYLLKKQNSIRLSPVNTLVPVNNLILNHTISMLRHQALRYFARLPTNSAETGSLALCYCLLPIASFTRNRYQFRTCNSD
jgi:hypothetical protein